MNVDARPPATPDSPVPAPRPFRPDALAYVPRDQMRWGVSDAAMGIALFLTTLGVLAITLQFVPEEASEVAGFAINVLVYSALAGTVVFASRRRGLRSLQADFGLQFRWVDLGIGLVLGIAAKIMLALYSSLSAVVTGAPPAGGNFTLSDDTLWVILSGLLFASLVAPFVEELFMRGLVLRAVRNLVLRGWPLQRPQPAARNIQVRAVVISIITSSFVFMVLHLWQTTEPALLIVLGLGTFTLGVFNGIAAVVTGRLGAAIVSHVVFNGSSVVILLLSRWASA